MGHRRAQELLELEALLEPVGNSHHTGSESVGTWPPLAARDEIVRELGCHKSVNLAVRGARVAWRGLLSDVKDHRLPDLGLVDRLPTTFSGKDKPRRIPQPTSRGPCPSPKLRSADIVTSWMLNGRHAAERSGASRHATGHGWRVATCLETRRGYAHGGQITRSKHNVVIAEAMVRLDGRAKRSYAARRMYR
jgi:hypothetical protein